MAQKRNRKSPTPGGRSSWLQEIGTEKKSWEKKAGETQDDTVDGSSPTTTWDGTKTL